MSELGAAFAAHLAAVVRLSGTGALHGRGADRLLGWLVADLAVLAAHPTSPSFEVGDGLVVCGERVRIRDVVADAVSRLAADLGRHGAGGVTLGGAPDRDAVLAFFRGLGTPGAGREALERWLERNGAPTFALLPPRPAAAEPAGGPEALKTYGRLGYAVAKARASGALPRVPPEVRQAMRHLVERAELNPRDHLALASMVQEEDGGTRHCVHAAILAVALGQRLGLRRGALLDLGLAALLAADLPEGAEESAVAEAVAAQLASSSLGVGLARRVVATWEHRLPVDRPRPAGLPHLFSRIVAVAVDYDRLVSPGGLKTGLLPDEALGRLQAQAGRRYDKALLVEFAEILGAWPLGSAVLLDGGEVGVVWRIQPGRRPVVRVVVDRRGAILRGGPLLDLAEKGARRIVATVSAARLGIDPADALFG